MSEFLYEVGDEFQGSPILQSKFISEVLSHGGLVGIDGDIVRILYLPGKGSIFEKEEAEAAAKDAEEAVNEPVEVTVLVPEGQDVAVEVVEVVPEAEEVVEEAVEAAKETAETTEDPKPAPKRTGRPRKTVTEE